MKYKDNLIKIIKQPWAHLIFLCLLMIFVFWQTNIYPMDDAFLYESFAEKIIDQGQIDLSIAGFHGADFFSALIYLITGSHFSIYYFNIICSILVIPLIYLAVREILGNKKLAVMAAYIYLLMPLEYMTTFRGAQQSAFLFFFFLALYFLFKKSKLTFLVMGMAYLVKPFAIAAAPFFIYKKQIKQFCLSLVIPLIYLGAQYAQVGRIIIGAHPELTTQTLFSLKRFFLNLVYTFQAALSIHNYSPINPTYHTDMFHLSPLITFLAILAVLFNQKYFPERKLFYTLLALAGLALVLPASFHHLDMWYLLVFNLALIFLALPVILDYQKLMPIIAFSFSFQFLYTFLAFRGLFWSEHNYIIFLIPGIIFLISLAYVKSLYYH